MSEMTASSAEPGKPRLREKGRLMSASEIERTLVRLAHEIVEKNDGAANLGLVGIKRRGVPLAERLAQLIEKIEKHPVDTGVLDISFYRDDLSTAGPRPVVHQGRLGFDVTGRDIVLMDDVLYTGRTIRAALDALFDHGRPKSVQLLVLIDRGHRELPIQATFTGRTDADLEPRDHRGEAERGRRAGAGAAGGAGGLTTDDARCSVMEASPYAAGSLLSVAHFRSGCSCDSCAMTTRLERMAAASARDLLAGRTIALLFYESSTRTRTSFELAAKSLGATTTLVSDKISSIEKGESLKDTGLTLRALGAECIVLRHPASGAPSLLARATGLPVLNAGDGMHQHPSQALLDLRTMLLRLPGVDGDGEVHAKTLAWRDGGDYGRHSA